MLVLRLAVGAGTHLTEDEAYYRLWSAAPALGYYDHPPMIAWWLWLGRHIAGDDSLGVRLAPILASAITSFLVFDLVRLAGAGRALAGRAGIWFNAMPLVAAGGFLAVPDSPASLFWTTTLWCVLRAARANSLAWWAAAGAAAGLATLSKYSALFLAPGMLIWLAWTPGRRAWLRTPGPWLAALVAVALFSLNIVWNADHHWLTFDKQFGRIAASRFAPGHLAELVIGQAVLLNPLIAMFATAAAFARRRRDHPAIDLSLFFATAAPFAAYLVIHSLHDRVQAHWPAPLYPGLAICAAVGAERLAGSAAWRRCAAAAAPFGFGLCGLLLTYLALPVSVVGRADLALPVRGWPSFAARLDRLQRESGAAWIGTTSYGLASELATEPALRAPILQLAERDRWTMVSTGVKAPDLARPGLVADLSRRVDAASLARCFARVTPLGQIARGDPGEAGKTYSVFVVAGPKRDILKSGC